MGDSPQSPQRPTTVPGDFAQLGDLLGERFDAARARPQPSKHSRAALPASGATADSALDRAAEIARAWPEVLGHEAAANTQPMRLSQGRLVVATSSTAWAQSLQFMEGTIAARLNERLRSPADAPVVERIAFRHAGWQSIARSSDERGDDQVAQTPPRGETGEALAADAAQATVCQAAAGDTGRENRGVREFTPEQEAALRSVEDLDLAPQLAAKIIGAMKASFVRGERESVR